MRFVRFDGDRLGLLKGSTGTLVDITDELGLTSPDPLLEFIRGDYSSRSLVDLQPELTLEDVRLEAPIRMPGKVVAAPSNYAEHQAEMSGGATTKPTSYFLKAPSSIIGPEDAIELPFADRRCDHEIELAFVMGTDVKDVSREAALNAVFGYTVLLDISMRGEEDRSHRKSFDTFTVVGPCVATPDDVGDPQDLRLILSLNGDPRQDSTTANMLRSCAEFIELASTRTTIRAGDIVTTGTPSGVGPLADGDVIDAEIENIGSMTLTVRLMETGEDDRSP